MRISEQGRQAVRPRDFWIAVLGVTALLGWMGVTFMQTGHVLSAPKWVGAALLLLVWLIMLVQSLRHGRTIWTPVRTAFLVGYTLFIGTDLMPHLARLTWLKDVGVALMVPSLLAQWFEFGKRPRTVSDETV